MNRIMRLDEKLTAKADLDKAMKFNFQSKAQFMMILESKGYTLFEKDGKMDLVRFGKKLLEVDLAFLKERKGSYQLDQARAGQITAQLHKFRDKYAVQLRPLTESMPGGADKIKHGYTCDLAEEFHRRFGIQLIFHGAPGKAPYGYSILDHAYGNVFKGGEIMDLKNLLAQKPATVSLQDSLCINTDPKSQHGRIKEDVKIKVGVEQVLPNQFNCSTDPLVNTSTVSSINNSDAQQVSNESAFVAFEQAVTIDISDDIDDEAVHGRNRQRKRQVRTNTR